MSDLKSILQCFTDAIEQPCRFRKQISVQEKGVKYFANVTPERDTAVLQVDGKIIAKGQKCDKLILSKDPKSEVCTIGHFVELKGCDIPHAIEQLEATISSTIFNSVDQKFARIVGNSFPASKANPIVEKARVQFKKRFNCNLKTLKSNQPDRI